MTNGMRRNSWHVALSAHNPEVATPPPPLPIGLSCTRTPAYHIAPDPQLCQESQESSLSDAGHEFESIRPQRS